MPFADAVFPLEDLDKIQIEAVVKRAFREASPAPADRRIDAAFIAMRKLGAIWNAFAEKRLAAAALQPVVAPINVKLTEYVEQMFTEQFAHTDDVMDAQASHQRLSVSCTSVTPWTTCSSGCCGAGSRLPRHLWTHGESPHPHSSGYFNQGTCIHAVLYLQLLENLDCVTLFMPQNLPDDVLQTFGQHRIRCGGVIRRLQFVHPFQECGGTRLEVKDFQGVPLFAGGQVDQAIERVKQGELLHSMACLSVRKCDDLILARMCVCRC